MRTMNRIDRIFALGYRVFAVIFALFVLVWAALGEWPRVSLDALLVLLCMWKAGYWRER